VFCIQPFNLRSLSGFSQEANRLSYWAHQLKALHQILHESLLLVH